MKIDFFLLIIKGKKLKPQNCISTNIKQYCYLQQTLLSYWIKWRWWEWTGMIFSASLDSVRKGHNPINRTKEKRWFYYCDSFIGWEFHCNQANL